jgi:hypothetical protein
VAFGGRSKRSFDRTLHGSLNYPWQFASDRTPTVNALRRLAGGTNALLQVKRHAALLRLHISPGIHCRSAFLARQKGRELAEGADCSCGTRQSLRETKWAPRRKPRLHRTYAARPPNGFKWPSRSSIN